MTKSNLYARADKYFWEIVRYESKLGPLDRDYKKLQSCKQKLAVCSVYLKELITQSEELSEVFDRRKIEAKYDNCKLTFHNKEGVFEQLSKINDATISYSKMCTTLKGKIDSFGVTLDDACLSIGEEAKDINNKISQLQSDSINPIKYLSGD